MPNEKAKQNPWLFFADNDLALAEVAGIIKKEIKTPFQT